MKTSLTVSSAVQTSLWLLVIPLVLSAFTHLWNPIGFPYTHADEAIYLQRSMYVLRGLGPHESHPDSVLYDHPYFGQLFLAGVFKIIGYPDLLDVKSGDVHSIEMLYMIPRVLMGLLAVVDTFLIYKIAEVRYNSNRKVAFIASILFAVMPITWLTRWIFLDTIQLPLLLLSILFAVYYAKKKNSCSSSFMLSSATTKRTISSSSLVILSGIFLGLAIFTKIPAFTMIPLVGYIIISSSYTNTNKNKNQNNNNNDSGTSTSTITKRLGRSIITNLRNLNFKALGIWFIPVILIPLIWPAYAISGGQLNEWIGGVLWQATERPNYKTLFNSLNDFFKIDPLLLVLGISGIVFATVAKKRSDTFFFLLWITPFLIFLYVVGYVSLFHLIPLIPAFCIAAAITIVDLLNRILVNYTGKGGVVVKQTLLLFVMVSAIGIFGLISTSMLITTNRNSSFFEVYAFIVQHLPNKISADDKIVNNNNNKVTMIGNNWGTGAGVWSFSWIPKYVFQKDLEFTGISNVKVKTEKVILIADNRFLHAISDDHSDSKKGELLRSLYNGATTTVKVFKENGIHYPYDQYPYTSMSYNNKGIGRIEIRTNYK